MRSQVLEQKNQHWALLPFVAGILLGLIVSTLILVRPQNDSDLYSSEEKDTKRKFRDEFNRFMEELKQRERGIKRLSEDVAMKDIVYYAVMATEQSSAESLKTVKETWGGNAVSKNIEFFAPSDKGTVYDNDIITLPVTRPLEIETLNYLCKHKMNETKWFFMSYDNVYVKTEQFEQFLLSLETLPIEFGYIGKPVRRESVNGRVCMTGPGIVLSASVLHQLCPRLNQCLQDSTDTVLGECIRNQLPYVECVKDLKFHERFLKFDKERKGSVLEAANKNVFERALTVYPVDDSSLMYAIHQTEISRRSSHFQNIVQELTQTLHYMKDLLPSADLRPYKEKVGVAMTEDDIIPWTLISDNQYMSCTEPRPAFKIHTLWKQELDLLSTATVDYINSREEEKYTFSKIGAVYLRQNNQLGTEYMMDIETKLSEAETGYSSPTSRFRATLLRGYGELEVNPVLKRVDQSQSFSVVVMVTNDYIENFEQFMRNFEEILKITLLKLNLIAVHMETNANAGGEIDNIISSYSSKHSQTYFKLLKSSHKLSQSHGLALVLQELDPNDLLFISDLNLRFDLEFITRCRWFPIKTQQVYYPIPFMQADPALLSATDHTHFHNEITSHAGHWLVDSNAIACFYAADALAVVKQADDDSNIVPEEISVEDLYSQFISSGYSVVRSADKGIRKVFSRGRCDLDYYGNEHDPCQSLPESYEKLYLKTQLSVLLLDHEGKHAHKKY